MFIRLYNSLAPSLPIHSAPATQPSCLLLDWAMHALRSGPSHVLCPLPGMPLLRRHLTGKGFPILYKRNNPRTPPPLTGQYLFSNPA